MTHLELESVAVIRIFMKPFTGAVVEVELRDGALWCRAPAVVHIEFSVPRSEQLGIN